MSASRSSGSVRSLTFLNTLLMASAFTVPAFAQIETVVVTAEKRAENLQTVPVAVTAISGEDLKKKEITTYKDLQYNVPNLTFTKSGLGSGIVTIRGITQAAGDPGVAQYQDGIYKENADLASASYYDLQTIEVNRGPQGTLYGRGSVGGTINAIPNKPDMDEIQAKADFTYGEFATKNADAMVNVPIIDDVLAVRVAGNFMNHNGFTQNTAPGAANPNGQNVFSVRGSVRWQPMDGTTIDFSSTYSKEDDTRTTADNVGCLRDPTGTLGCLPDGLALNVENAYASTGGLFASTQFFTSFGQLTGGVAALALESTTGTGTSTRSAFIQNIATPAGGAGTGIYALCGGTKTTCAVDGGSATASVRGKYTAALAKGYGIIDGRAALTDLSVLNGPGSLASIQGLVPTDPLKVYETFTPKFDEAEQSYSFHLNQKLGSSLTADFVLGMSQNDNHFADSFFHEPDDKFNTTGCTAGASPSAGICSATHVGQAIAALNTAASFYELPPFHNSPTRIGLMDAYYFPGGNVLPTSANTPGGLVNLTSGIQNFGTTLQVTNLQQRRNREESMELRFTSNFDGWFNFVTGLYWWHRNNSLADYRVPFTSGDYGSIFMGQTFGALIDTSGFPDGGANSPAVAMDPGYYQNAPSRAHTKAWFGDATIDLVPDTLTAHVGLRWSEDQDTLSGNVSSFLGFNNAPGAGAPCHGGDSAEVIFICFGFPAPGSVVTPAATKNYVGTAATSKTTSLWNYRGVLTYTPKLDFTDQTMVYLSYSEASKPGGLNLVPASAPPGAIPANFAPEELRSLELGTKNTFFDGTVTANLTAWYYDYTGFQFTSVAFSTLFTQNIGGHLWGGEGEFLWQPDEHFALNVNLTDSDSSIGNFTAVDQRNATNNFINSTSAAVYVKDAYINAVGDFPGGHCVVISSAKIAGNIISPADDPIISGFYASQGFSNPFFAPPQGSNALAGHGVPLTNFGSCTVDFAGIGNGLIALGGPFVAIGNQFLKYHYAGPADSPGSSISGIAESLHGKQFLGLPKQTVNVGAQYTFDFDDYAIVPRVDYYYQTGFFDRVFNDIPDRVPSWDSLNLSLQVTAPDTRWYVKGFVTNVVNNRNEQGAGAQGDTAGLYTGLTYQDPRVFGVQVGAHW